ncbi:MAG TPA: hypothetical protein VFL81_00990 [Candidatus Saccharimonadales bacterium]|nr:hypothetical protein [Candidatus Saccharimonadales bacterium]
MHNINFFATSPAILAFLATAFAAGCFQLSVSVLTLISSHTIGAARSFNKLLGLISAYLLGVIASIFALSILVITLADASRYFLSDAAWPLVGVVSIVVGGLIVAFYYRQSKGTSLWVPRSMARFLNNRTKRTRSAIETFSLGILTTVAELPFSFVAFLILAYLVKDANANTQVALSLIYALAVSLPLLFVAAAITSGHKISAVQRWRESNKNFLRWSSGVCLVLLGVYVLVWQTSGVTG